MRKGRPQQFFRRVLQLGVLGFICYAAMGTHWRNYKLAHNHPRLVALIEGDFWGRLYAWNEQALSALGEPFRASFSFLGLPWSGRVFGLDTADPLLVAGQLVTQPTGLSPSLWAALVLPVVLALALGKVFCSHLCPMRLLFELGQAVRAGLLRMGLPLPEWRSAERYGGWALLGGLLATLAVGPAVWLFVLPYVSLSASLFLWLAAGTASVLALVVLFWFSVDVLLAPGYFCHNLCPTGALLEPLARLSRFRVAKVTPSPCPPSCNLCEESCPFSLRPMEELPMSGCNNCGRCVPACPSGKLSRRLVGLASTAVALVTAFGISWNASPALAHHNKGLPHYGYYENYPQVPVDEYVIIDGPWEMGATLFNFQGLDRRIADTPNDVKIYLYLYDDRTRRAYDGPLEVQVRERFGDVISTFQRVSVDEESVYSTRETLPRSGDYELVARVGDEEIVLPFYVDLAPRGIRWDWVAAFTVPVLVLAGLGAAGRGQHYAKRRRGASTA